MTDEFSVAIVAGVFALIGAAIGFFFTLYIEKERNKLEIKKIKIEFALTSRVNAYQEFSKIMREIQVVSS